MNGMCIWKRIQHAYNFTQKHIRAKARIANCKLQSNHPLPTNIHQNQQSAPVHPNRTHIKAHHAHMTKYTIAPLVLEKKQKPTAKKTRPPMRKIGCNNYPWFTIYVENTWQRRKRRHFHLEKNETMQSSGTLKNCWFSPNWDFVGMHNVWTDPWWHLANIYRN